MRVIFHYVIMSISKKTLYWINGYMRTGSHKVVGMGMLQGVHLSEITMRFASMKNSFPDMFDMNRRDKESDGY